MSFSDKEILLQIFSPNFDRPIRRPMRTIVGEQVEFKLLPENEINGGSLVDVQIDVTSNSILFDFSQSSPSTQFGSGQFNGYVFFDSSEVLPPIRNVTIDRNATTLNLDNSDIRFAENTIYVNVEDLSFNTDSFIKLNVEFETVSPLSNLFFDRNAIELITQNNFLSVFLVITSLFVSFKSLRHLTFLRKKW